MMIFIYICSVVLWDNNIGDEGAKYFAEVLKINSTIQTIKWVKLTDIFLRIKNINIYWLNFTPINYYFLSLGSNYIGDEGAKYLSDALKINSTVKTI